MQQVLYVNAFQSPPVWITVTLVTQNSSTSQQWKKPHLAKRIFLHLHN